MQSSMLRAIVEDFGNGGTIEGDLTISGDLTVSGTSGGFAYTEVITGDMIIDQDSNAGCLTIDSEATSNDIISVVGPTLNSGHVIHISAADALTTGSAMRVDCGSTALASTSSGGLVEILHDANSTSNVNNLLYIVNDHASSTGTTGLKIKQDSSGLGMNIHSGFTSAADAGARLRLYTDDGAVMASGHRLGVLEFGGAEDTSSTITVGARIEAVTDNTWSDTENGAYISFYITDGNNSQTEMMRIDNNSRISLSNNDDNTGNTIFGYQAWNGHPGDDDGSDQNTIIGHLAAGSATIDDARDNTAVGYKAAQSLTSGDNNTAIGSNSLFDIAGGAGNTALGYKSGFNISAGDFNTAIGKDALFTETVGNGSTAIGNGCLYTQAIGSDTDSFNVGVGYQSGYTNATGTNNTYVGYRTGYGATGNNSNNVGIGSNAMLGITTGSGNVAMGSYALGSMLTGLSNVAIGGYDGTTVAALRLSTAAGQCVAIGTGALSAVVTTAANGTVAIGYKSLAALTSGAGNTAIGYQSLLTVTGAGNTAIGYETGKLLLAASENVIIGYQAFDAADGNEGQNVVIGAVAGGNIDDDASDSNVLIGWQAGLGGDAALASCVVIGHSAMNGTADDAQTGTVAIGATALSALTSGAGNTAVGYQSMKENTTGANNTVLGYAAMSDTSGEEGNLNVFIGKDSGGGQWASNPAHYNVAVGALTMDAAMNNAEYNTALGYQALSACTTGQHNTVIGSGAGTGMSTGYSNVFVGKNAGATSDAPFNTMLGAYADVDAAGDSHQVKIGSYGIIKYKTARITITAAHSGVDSVIAEICKIPALSIIHRASVTVITKSGDLNPYTLNLQLSTSTGTAADGALVNASTTITAPEILGAGAANTYQQNSGIAMAGTAADILAGTGGVDKTVYTNQPTTTIVGTADTYLYICNAVDNGTTASSAGVILDVCVEYTGQD